MDHYSYGLALAAGIGSAALGYAGKRLYQYRKNRHNPQSLGIKVTRLQKQDTTEKKKKEKVKEKQNEYLFDVKQYLASFKEGTTTTTTAQVSDESSTISAGGGVLARFEGKKQRSARILLTEFENLVETPIPNIGLLPEKNNLFVWHCNIIPQYGASKGAVFHFIIRIPDEYPENAPTAENCTPSAVYLYPFSSWDTTMSLSTEMQRIEQQLNVLTTDLTAQTKAVILPKVHHDSNKQAWPPVPKSGLLTMLTAKEDTFAEKKKKQLVCFYTKQNHEQAKLGLGITFNKNIRTGELQQIRCTQHLVSLKAFNRYKIRNIDRMNCTHWLPVYICPSHAPMRLVERAISLICTGTSDSFEPDQVLKVLPKLMNNLLVETATGVLPGVTGLRLYCLIHRLLLALNEQYPAIGKKATQFISDFIHNDAARHKNVTPNLGELIAMLSITDLTWSDLKGAYYRESSVRNAYWIIKTHPQLDPEYKEKMRKKRLEELKEMKDDSSSIHEFEDEEEEEEITEEERIEKSFAVTRVGKQILAFQIFIQQNIAQPSNITRQQIAKQYDDFFGAPVDNIETAFIEEIAFIKGNNFRTDDYLAAIAMPILSDEDLAAQLIRDMHESKKKGYHGEIILNTIIKPEEFAKLNRIDLKKFFEIENYELVLHSDEAKWKQEAEQRWGIQSIVEHCSSWRETYLCNHLRDVVEGLNDSLDFDYVYSTAEQCNNYITFLELELFNPTNLKSRYFFLAKVLDKLNNLKTFKLLKGADALDPKAFKALCMGLNRCKKLSTLILDNCKLTANDLQYLLTNDLVSDSITKLKLSGNHIGNDGVVLIAKFLGNHKTLPNLEELSLNGCKINTVSPLADSLIFKTKLKVVELKNNAMGGETSALLKKAAYCTSLESINVAGTSAYIDSTSLTTNLTITSALKTLVLYKALSISLDSNFVKAFGGNTTLTTLDLGCSGISSMPHLGQALAANKSLKTLILQSCRISAAGLCQLVENIKDKGGLTLIEELDLSENLMYPNAILEENRKFSKKERSEFDILGELLRVAPNLKSLNLGSCSLHYKSLVKFSEVLESHDSLHKLDLKKNKYIVRSIHHLVNALKKNTVLEVLDISGSNIGASGAISISEAVLHNVALKNLSIYGNFIGPDGCCGILEALRKNPKSSLKELDMGLNRIKARGVKLLIDLINDEKYTFPLTYIGLKDDHINDIMALRLVSSIVKTKNQTNKIEMITLHGNKLRGTTINQIASDLSVANIKFDLSKLVEAKQQDKQQRTVYLPSLSMSITPEAIKRMFYKSYCGAIISVDIHPHKRRGDFASAKYAFVEFAEQESVSIAMTLAGNKKNTIGSNIIRIYRAGITQN